MAIDLPRDAATGLPDRRHGVRVIHGQRDVERVRIHFDRGKRPADATFPVDDEGMQRRGPGAQPVCETEEGSGALLEPCLGAVREPHGCIGTAAAAADRRICTRGATARASILPNTCSQPYWRAAASVLRATFAICLRSESGSA